MGSSLCCTREICHDPLSSPNKRYNLLNDQSLQSSTIIRLRRNGTSGLLYTPYYAESPDSKSPNGESNSKFRKDFVNRVQQWKTQQVFCVDIPFEAKSLSFSQRRFVGFRCKFEFDKKRILVASNNEITILGYDQLERPFELYRGNLRQSLIQQMGAQDEELLLAQFLEDQIPSYIFVVQQKEKEKKVEFRILKLKKNRPIFVDNKELDIQQFSNMECITDTLFNHLKQGDFNQHAKRKYDNIQLTPKSNVKLFKNPNLKLFRKQQQSQIPSLDTSKLENSVHHNSTTLLQIQDENLNMNLTNLPRNIKAKKVQSFKIKRGKIQKLDLSETTNYWNQESQLPFVLEEYGNLLIRGTFSKVQLFHSANGNYLFTLEQKRKVITIYLIKACVSQTQKNTELKSYTSPKISNFRMAKKSTLNLEFEPNCIDLYADYFLLSYLQPCPYVDSYERNGQFHERYDINKILNRSNFELISITQAVFPRIKWSDRKMEEFDTEFRLQLLKKFLVIGECKRKDDNNQLTATEKADKKVFIMLYNLQKHQGDKLKLINLREAEISCINYGPFDNGYLLLGLTNGILLGINLHEMEIILQEQVFDNAIKQISFEPTNLVFLTSESKEMVALNLVKKELHYVYLELSKKQYCTVTVPNTHQNSPDESQIMNNNMNDNDNVNDDVCFKRNHDNHNPLRICC